MTLVEVDGVDGSGCGWFDNEDVVVVAGVVAEVVAEVFVVGKGSPKYLTLETFLESQLRSRFGRCLLCRL